MGEQSRITTKGQVTVPRDVQDALGLRPGDLVQFKRSNGAVFVEKGVEVASPSFEDRVERARALSNPSPLGMTTDEYMTWVREPLPPYDE